MLGILKEILHLVADGVSAQDLEKVHGLIEDLDKPAQETAPEPSPAEPPAGA